MVKSTHIQKCGKLSCLALSPFTTFSDNIDIFVYCMSLINIFETCQLVAVYELVYTTS